MTARIRPQRWGTAARSIVIASPVAALCLIDVRLGLAGLVGAGVAVVVWNQADRPAASPPPPPPSPSPPVEPEGEALAASHGRERMREIEIEALQGELFDLERRLREAQSESSQLLELFDVTESADADVWLHRVQRHLRMREAAALPSEPVAIADVIVGHAAGAGWRPGDVTIADSLPVVLAPRALLEWLVALIFEGWTPLGPITVRGGVDGAMATIRVHGLGLDRWSQMGPTESVRHALDLMGGALLPDRSGVAFTLPITVSR